MRLSQQWQQDIGGSERSVKCGYEATVHHLERRNLGFFERIAYFLEQYQQVGVRRWFAQCIQSFLKHVNHVHDSDVWR